MVSKEDILHSVGEFVSLSIEDKGFHRITRTKEELEGKLEFILHKIQDWFRQEQSVGYFKIFKETQEKSLFHQSWSLKKAILYIKSAMKSIGYEMIYNSFPGNKIITLIDTTTEKPISITRDDPPRPFKIRKGRFYLRFSGKGDDDIEFL